MLPFNPSFASLSASPVILSAHVSSQLPVMKFLYCFQGGDQTPLSASQWPSWKGLFLLLHFSPVFFTRYIPVLLSNLCKWCYAFAHFQDLENIVFFLWMSFTFSLLPFIFLIPTYPPESCLDATSFRKLTLSFKTQRGSALWAPRAPCTYIPL